MVGDKQEEMDSQDRDVRRKLSEYETRTASLTQVNTELREEAEQTSATLRATQERLSEQEIACQNLETEVLRVKAQTGDLETLKVLKKELSEQVAHIKTLESTNRKQLSELKQLRDFGKSLELVQEEKTALETKLRMMDTLRDELSSVHLRVSILQDERNAWSSYLESEGLEFDSPESLARALIQERLEKATLLEQAGRINPTLHEKEATISELEQTVKTLCTELETMKEAGAKDTKARGRLERQRALALKEAQFLREQLKSFQTEETIYMEGKFDEQKNQRIEELERLLEDYKKELEEVRAEMAKREAGSESPVTRKRAREDDDEVHERLGELTRKNRQLQEGSPRPPNTVTGLATLLLTLHFYGRTCAAPAEHGAPPEGPRRDAPPRLQPRNQQYAYPAAQGQPNLARGRHQSLDTRTPPRRERSAARTGRRAHRILIIINLTSIPQQQQQKNFQQRWHGATTNT